MFTQDLNRELQHKGKKETPRKDRDPFFYNHNLYSGLQHLIFIGGWEWYESMGSTPDDTESHLIPSLKCVLQSRRIFHDLIVPTIMKEYKVVKRSVKEYWVSSEQDYGLFRKKRSWRLNEMFESEWRQNGVPSLRLTEAIRSTILIQLFLRDCRNNPLEL